MFVVVACDIMQIQCLVHFFVCVLCVNEMKMHLIRIPTIVCINVAKIRNIIQIKTEIVCHLIYNGFFIIFII